MNKILTTLICTATVYNLSAQNGNGPGQANGQGTTHWQINGNNADSNNYIGTKNKQDLIFKANQIEVFRITPQSELKLKGDIIFEKPLPKAFPGELNLLGVDGKGKVTSLDKSGLLTGIYTQLTPCFLLEDMNGSGGMYPAPVWTAASTPNYGVLHTGSVCDARVGIGTNQPRTSLDVIGNIKSTRIFLGNQMPSNLTEHYLYLKTSMGPNTNADIVKIENNSRQIFQINNNGLVRAREIKVDLDIWPDYVFEQNYPLMPLKEVESYINTHKHLPAVPSQNEIMAEGLNLGEMNKILMQKVEELTLYLIEQQKVLQQQQEQLNQQQQQIDLLKTTKN